MAKYNPPAEAIASLVAIPTRDLMANELLF